MLLAIDIGNTNVVYGAFRNDRLMADFRIATPIRITPDELGLSLTHFLIRNDIPIEGISRVVLASVVPSLTSVFERAVDKYIGQEPLVISHRLKLPITIDVDFPDQVGADRIANAAAGYSRWGGPVIIVDFGTATTFDVVNADGAYVGGVIIAGPETSVAELARRAAKLFEVRIEKPDHVVGRSTAEALKSGAFYGLIGQIDYIIDRILEDQGFESCKVVATGGLAFDIEKHSRHISEVAPSLTLEGLRIIAEGA
jgi:type III pantothenate kinase